MKKCIPMNVPQELAQATFVKKNRFCLISDEFPEYSVHKVKVNYARKLIEVHFYDITTPDELGFDPIHWIQNLEVNPETTTSRFCLETYRGDGLNLYRVHFNGLQVVDHEMDFDYEVSDVATRKVTFLFHAYNFETEFKRTMEPKQCRWILSVRDTEDNAPRKFDATIVNRPSCNILPRKVSMLNSDVFVPDLVEWSACVVHLKDTYTSDLVGNKHKVTLTKEINHIPHEEWEFADPCLMLNADQDIEIKSSNAKMKAFKRNEHERTLPKSSCR